MFNQQLKSDIHGMRGKPGLNLRYLTPPSTSIISLLNQRVQLSNSLFMDPMIIVLKKTTAIKMAMEMISKPQIREKLVAM
jgi:hypothetical protein